MAKMQSLMSQQRLELRLMMAANHAEFESERRTHQRSCFSVLHRPVEFHDDDRLVVCSAATRRENVVSTTSIEKPLCDLRQRSSSYPLIDVFANRLPSHQLEEPIASDNQKLIILIKPRDGDVRRGGDPLLVVRQTWVLPHEIAERTRHVQTSVDSIAGPKLCNRAARRLDPLSLPWRLRLVVPREGYDTSAAALEDPRVSDTSHKRDGRGDQSNSGGATHLPPTAMAIAPAQVVLDLEKRPPQCVAGGVDGGETSPHLAHEQL
mmetsp:Transcript_124512/g.359985  ORF Transcript_124512/g.359985 Transcript_124512/m.359985 type:complete len:264 (+) Transcript_124512:244-1035(+)